VLAGDPAEARGWQKSLEREFRPGVSVIDVAGIGAPAALRKGEIPPRGAADWVCRGLQCLPPVFACDRIAELLAT
jgi:Highly conserved protein containing a thioredoxin domain